MTKKLLTFVLTILLSASILAGCGLPSTEQEADESQQSTDTNEDAQASDSTSDDEEITLRVVDWSDSTAERRKIFNEKYMELNPNIKIEYTTMTVDQFKSSVVTAIKSGEAPDLFPIPVGITLPTAVQGEWFLPLNDYFTDNFLDTIIEPAKSEGVAKLDGTYYTLPEVQALTNQLIFYNQDVLDKAGITELPTTYSEFVEVNKQITEAGNGEYYGFIEGGKQINRMYALLQGFSNTGGAKIPDFTKALVVDGRISYDSEPMLEAVAMFDQIREDGSLHPDTININAPEAREYFAQGQAAFIMQGIWCIGVWESTHPEMNFGTMAVPVPDSGQKGKISTPEYSAWMGVYSQTDHPKEAAEYLMALYNYGNEEYTYQDDLVAYGGQLSIVKGVVEENLTNERVKQYYKLGQETAATYPIATVRNPKVYDFYNEVVDVQPGLGNLFQGILSGGLDDYEEPLTALSNDLTSEWTRASEAVGITIDTFNFPNWDQMKDYTEDMYDELD